MWIGEVPPELSILTLLERVLMVKYFPAAYIVKLFPRQKGASHWSSSGLHSGVKGNVSTYKLNVEEIMDIVDPRIMPPPTKILASIIGVIIVGPKNMLERTMHGILESGIIVSAKACSGYLNTILYTPTSRYRKPVSINCHWMVFLMKSCNLHTTQMTSIN
jgi:hypothetical protein